MPALDGFVIGPEQRAEATPGIEMAARDRVDQGTGAANASEHIALLRNQGQPGECFVHPVARCCGGIGKAQTTWLPAIGVAGSLNDVAQSDPQFDAMAGCGQDEHSHAGVFETQRQGNAGLCIGEDFRAAFDARRDGDAGAELAVGAAGAQDGFASWLGLLALVGDRHVGATFENCFRCEES